MVLCSFVGAACCEVSFWGFALRLGAACCWHAFCRSAGDRLVQAARCHCQRRMGLVEFIPVDHVLGAALLSLMLNLVPGPGMSGKGRGGDIACMCESYKGAAVCMCVCSAAEQCIVRCAHSSEAGLSVDMLI